MILNKKNRIIAIALLVAMIFTFTFAFQNSRGYFDVHANTEVYGIVSAEGEGLNIRSGPSSQDSIIRAIADDTRIKIINYEEGQKWYQMELGEISGYVYAEFIVIEVATPDSPYEPESDFEAYLTSQGFPESYKVQLRKLHAKYPKWKFVAAHTKLDWEQVLYKETNPVNRSLTHISEDDSYKSMEPGAYSFASDSYIGLDSSSWIAASKEAVAFHMDPRNSLDEYYIFQFLSAKYDSGTNTPANLQNLLNGTFMAGTIPGSSKTYNQVLLEAGKAYKANPMVLAAMILTEQGHGGTGGSIKGNIGGYSGIYNYFNVMAYGNPDPVRNGLNYAAGTGSYGRPWNTRERSIKGGAQFYANSYIYNNKYTIYLKKWNVMNGIGSVGTMQYMTNIRGADSEGYDLSSGYEAIKNNALTFEIPVFQNMPAKACPKPSATGNNNNYLENIIVSNSSITPTFSRYKTSYEGVVSYNVTTVNITPIRSDSGARVSGGGSVELEVGTNNIPVVVTSSSGATRTYNLKIARQKPPAGWGDYEIVDGYVTKVSEQTSVDQFKTNLSNMDGLSYDSAQIVSKSGDVVTTGKIGTGMTLRLLDESDNLIKEGVIIIKGDISGDGKVSSLDYINIKKHIMSEKVLTGYYLEAADASGDSKITSLDYVRVRKHIMGESILK